VQQGEIRGKADRHTTVKREVPKAKQVLRKCLMNRPQSEKKCGSRYLFSQNFYYDNCFNEKIRRQIEPP
jgi:hypothetical protein